MSKDENNIEELKKDEVPNLPVNEQKVEKILNIGAQVANKIQELGLDKEGEKILNNAQKVVNTTIEAKVNELATGVSKNIEEKFEEIKKSLKTNIDKDQGVGNVFKQQIAEIAIGAVDSLQGGVKEALNQGKQEVIKLGQDLGKQAGEAIKVVFGNVMDLIKGTKNRSQAWEGIKGCWQEAGKRLEKEKTVAKEAEKKEQPAVGKEEKPERSFVEKLGLSEVKKPEKFVEREEEKKNRPRSQSVGRS